jgi:DNA-cytosine methyltransferase
MKYGDLFSGLGCVAIALKQQGFKFDYEFACDIDKHCKTNLLHNHNPNIFYDDVRDIQNLPHVDLFTAGFPCQPFSTANTKNGGAAHKSYDLFTETIRCIRLCKPKVFILENVKGLLTKTHAEYFKYISQTLDEVCAELGMKWEYRLLNSKEYGIPQSRPRIYFVASQNPKFPVKQDLLYTLESVIDTTISLQPFITRTKAHWKQGVEHNVLYIDNGQSTGEFAVLRKMPIETCYCLTAAVGARVSLYIFPNDTEILRRKLTSTEYMKLMYLIDENGKSWYNNICTDSQFCKQIGNGMDCHMMGLLIKHNLGIKK